MPDTKTTSVQPVPPSSTVPASSAKHSISELFADFLFRTIFLGLFLRLTIRDLYYPFSVFFYALPLAVLSILSLIAFLIYSKSAILKKKRFNSATISFVLWISFSIWWSQTMFFTHLDLNRPISENENSVSHPEDSKQTQQILFWNVSHFNLGQKKIFKAIKESSADLIGIAESGVNTARNQKNWEKEFPDFHVLAVPGGMVLLSRDPILKSEHGFLEYEGRYLSAEIKTKSSILKVIFIDINGHPLDRRDRAINFLTKMVKPLDNQPMIVMGDFNTPTDSLLFTDFRKQFRNTFEENGNGYAATWPAICPVLVLDQIWTNKFVESSQSMNQPTLLSDHNRVITKISILPINRVKKP